MPDQAADGATRLAWAMLGAATMRAFARRLPGFTHAGPFWLRANVLPRTTGISHIVEAEAETLNVTLEPPPLALLLQMTGIARERYQLPGTPPLAVALSLAER
jgi:hypothetical protein